MTSSMPLGMKPTEMGHHSTQAHPQDVRRSTGFSEQLFDEVHWQTQHVDVDVDGSRR
jgi:hypothetical protein